MEEAMNESASQNDVKRRDLLRQTATVLFSSLAAAGALEAVPLPASAQHVIGFAMVKPGSLLQRSILERRRVSPVPSSGQPQTTTGPISALAVLNIPWNFKASSGPNPPPIWQQALEKHDELAWASPKNGAAPPDFAYNISVAGAATAQATQIYGSAGEARYGNDGKTGVPLFDASASAGGQTGSSTTGYNDQIWLLIWK